MNQYFVIRSWKNLTCRESFVGIDKWDDHEFIVTHYDWRENHYMIREDHNL